MMGGHHAMSGAAAWLAITTPVSIGSVDLGFGALQMDRWETLAGAIVCAGAALLPDADHHGATIARSLPPISSIFTRIIGKVSGGHRNGTHSILGMAFFILLAWLANGWAVQTAALGIVYPAAALFAVLLISFAVKSVKFMPPALCWVIALAAGAFVGMNTPEENQWFLLAVAVGVAAHVLGDMLTIGGCNLIWPIKIRSPRWFRRLPVIGSVWKANGRVAVPVLAATGSAAEWTLASLLTVYVGVALIVA
ncbi:hydrolase [Arthrobacter sp. YC-RL1]|uniref:Metal-dependent hydrolase n=2 Tax=Micrococcales TaxID=85006 RepID=A0A365YN07_9MICC|nr:metal-dependent hydrolase [Glutamicibacter soli]ALD64222.1 hydrolase [Arthrobacter sp. LS16]ALQ30518.1 hydrolase [Arthrobacter sp. YC-RL1]KLI88187.1 hydrolase [Arthrobacter sp. YC-RL1]RBM04072.1 metal-dependent hydrolase [Glutamicibacter soli]